MGGPENFAILRVGGPENFAIMRVGGIVKPPPYFRRVVNFLHHLIFMCVRWGTKISGRKKIANVGGGGLEKIAILRVGGLEKKL